jgi:hypothetical protein
MYRSMTYYIYEPTRTSSASLPIRHAERPCRY